VETERAFASVLVAALDESDLSRLDRALAQEIVLGVLRWQRSLDYFVERYSGRPCDRLDLAVLIALRIGLYQLRHLTRIPQSAAVSESVNLVRHARIASASGLVNAVLRKAAANLDEVAGLGIADPFERASVQLSHPRWMLERWQASLGDDQARELALANNTPPATAFRVNTLRKTRNEALSDLNVDGLATRESEIAPGAFVVESGPASVIYQAAKQGLIYVQDQASQLVSTLLEPESCNRVLDLCAAPGSKSTHIAALAEDKAWVIACDLYPHRLSALRAACRRLGVESVDALGLDATQTLPFFENLQNFDRVLVDAPCSGTGTLRGNPEIKWRLSREDITRLGELQSKLLELGASSVASGARLVYSTCSIEREENEDVVNRFLQNGAAFRLVRPAAPSELITSEGFVRTFPHRHGTDGFFAAVLQNVR
jgi:16S rRNA (cytosine967-C5)-methyltransferase